jgi:hypothetical protein
MQVTHTIFSMVVDRQTSDVVVAAADGDRHAIVS